MKKINLTLMLLSIVITGFCTTWTITNSSITFVPASITITSGDSVKFQLESMHNVVEVSQATWNANGNTSLPGFSLPYGGGLVLPAKLTVGTHYYVCFPHASLGMKGVIIVQSPKCNLTVSAGNDQTICSGTSVVLNADGAAIYSWSTNSQTQSVTVNPSVTTTYKLTGTVSSGCSNTAQAIVTVNNPLVVNAGADVTITSGQSTTLTATGGGTYKWIIDNGQLIMTQNANVSPTVTTTYTVTGTMNNCTASDAVVVTVIAQTCTANAGQNQAICIGNSATLTATGGNTYKWTIDNGQLIMTQNVVVNPTITSTYTVIATSGTCTASANVTVTVNPLPAITVNDQTICSGTTVVLSADGGAIYSWSTNSLTQSVTVNPSVTTTYKLTGTVSSGCSNTAQAIVTVNNPPVVNAGADVTITRGDSTMLYVPGGISVVWSNGSKQNMVYVKPTTTSIYTVTGTMNNCTASDAVVVTVMAQTCTANAGQNQAICMGNSATLTATGGNTYKWTIDNGQLIMTQNVVVNPTITSTYTVIATSGTCTASASAIVTVNPLPAITVNDQTICSGTSVVLNAGGGAIYSWSTNSLTQSVTVNPSVTTTYKLTGTVSSGCSNTAQSVVTVNNSPVVNAGADVTINKGDSTMLYVSGEVSVVWSNGSKQNMLYVNPTTTTTYTVTGTMNNCTASDAVVVSVKVQTCSANAGADKTICKGNSAILTASGGDTYQWIIDNGQLIMTQSVTVNPTITTTYIVTTTKVNCTASDNVVVTVNSVPLISAGPDKMINIGSTITLTVKGGSNYQWSNGEITATISVTPTITSTYKVTGYNSVGCTASDEIAVTVNSAPIAGAGNDVTICLLDTPRLTATGGSYYQWSTGSRRQSIIANPTTTTTYKVTVSGITGATATASVVVTVIRVIADAGPDKTVCKGTPVNITASGGDTYSWNTGETTQSITVSPLSLKLYIVTVSPFANNKCKSSDAVIVRIKNNPIVNGHTKKTICKGYPINLNVTYTSAGDKWLWNTGAITQSITVSPLVISSVYTVTITNAGGCIATDDYRLTMVNCKDNNSPPTPLFEKRGELGFEIYPNPFNLNTAIDYQLSESSNVQLNVYDLIGNKVEVLFNGIKDRGDYSLEWNRKDLISGVYFIEMKTESQTFVKKVIVY